MQNEMDMPYDAGEQRQASNGLYIKFSYHPQQNEAKSLDEGRPVFDDVEFVQIMVPGDKLSIINRPVRADDKRQYAHQYKAWKAGDNDALSGTPLTEWPGITRSQVEELAYFKVRTVEQLAAMTDGNAQNVGPIHMLRQKAKAYLDKAKADAPSQKLVAALADRDNEIETLRRNLKELGDRVEAQAKSKK